MITFHPENYRDEIDVRNAGFDPQRAEDPVFNPRHIKRPIYPELRISETNATWFLDFLGHSKTAYLPPSQLGDFLVKINMLETGVSNLFKAQKQGSLQREYYRKLLEYLYQLDIIVRTCLHFNTNLVWA